MFDVFCGRSVLCLCHAHVLFPRDNIISFIFFVVFAGDSLVRKDFSAKVSLYCGYEFERCFFGVENLEIISLHAAKHKSL